MLLTIVSPSQNIIIIKKVKEIIPNEHHQTILN